MYIIVTVIIVVLCFSSCNMHEAYQVSQLLKLSVQIETITAYGECWLNSLLLTDQSVFNYKIIVQIAIK